LFIHRARAHVESIDILHPVTSRRRSDKGAAAKELKAIFTRQLAPSQPRSERKARAAEMAAPPCRI
jgi:hypothetical protein